MFDADAFNPVFGKSHWHEKNDSVSHIKKKPKCQTGVIYEIFAIGEALKF